MPLFPIEITDLVSSLFKLVFTLLAMVGLQSFHTSPSPTLAEGKGSGCIVSLRKLLKMVIFEPNVGRA